MRAWKSLNGLAVSTKSSKSWLGQDCLWHSLAGFKERPRSLLIRNTSSAYHLRDVQAFDIFKSPPSNEPEKCMGFSSSINEANEFRLAWGLFYTESDPILILEIWPGGLLASARGEMLMVVDSFTDALRGCGHSKEKFGVHSKDRRGYLVCGSNPPRKV